MIASTPSAEELAAIAAAWSLMQRRTLRPTKPARPRWSVAARHGSVADVTVARSIGTQSAWRAAGRHG
jgi:hypothetical protein